MRFFKAILSVTLLAATTILALPIGNDDHRSVSSEPQEATLSANDQPIHNAHVHHEITAAQPVNGHQTPVEAEGPDHKGDHRSSKHRSSTKNRKHRHEHVNKLGKRELSVKFGGQVPEDQKEAIKQQVIAHHNSLPAGHEQKGAVLAHVHKGWHLTPGEEHLGEHATFRYHGPGARNVKSQLGANAVHVSKPV